MDTANICMNERAVGRAIKRSGIDRDEVFVSSKLWPSVYRAGQDTRTRPLEFLREADTEDPGFSACHVSARGVECHPCHQQRELRSCLRARNILLEAWYPLGHGDRRLLEEPVFVRLAKRYGKTPAQIVLRWQYRWALPSSPARRILPILPRMPIYSIFRFPPSRWQR
ncbi:MAG: aldo/keto reductase [Coriobacteriaceae bacterium]|nr:MAG: aldo/keto reductase [Coriobacteriaceae bacterium]